MGTDAGFNDLVNVVQETMADVTETLQAMHNAQRTCVDAVAELGMHIHDPKMHCQVDERLIALESRSADGVAYGGGATVTHYADCGTAAGTAAKAVSLPGFILAKGSRVVVRFTITNTAANPSLNVNETGAKAIRYHDAAITAGLLTAGRTYEFVYDDSYYQYIGDTDTTYPDATQSARGLMSSGDKTKLDSIQAGAQVNPVNATQSANGLMSIDDKKKLDGIQAGAQVNPEDATQGASGLMSAADKQKLDGIQGGAQVNPGDATQGSSGLMSATDKQKLDGIACGATASTVPGNATQSSDGLMSSSDKTNLDGLVSRGGMVPQGYSANTTLAANTLYTASSNGFVICSGYFPKEGHIRLEGTLLGFGELSNGAESSQHMTFSIPIRKGQTYKIYMDTNHAVYSLLLRFMPCE